MWSLNQHHEDTKELKEGEWKGRRGRREGGREGRRKGETMNEFSGSKQNLLISKGGDNLHPGSLLLTLTKY